MSTPTHASVPRTTVSDLQREVTLEQVLQAAPSIAKSLVTLVQGLVEYWTDDDGLHVAQFTKDLSHDMEERLIEQLSVRISL